MQCLFHDRTIKPLREEEFNYSLDSENYNVGHNTAGYSSGVEL